MTPVWTPPRDGDIIGAFAWGGFVIDSNLDLPRLTAADAHSDLSFTWRFDKALPLGHATRQEEFATRTGGIVRVETWSAGPVRYQVETVGLYEVRADEAAIDFFPSPRADPMHVEHFLVNAVFPIYASARSIICLHASAVAENGRGTVFAGPSGSGKSTKAWEVVARGGRLLADDSVVIRTNEQGWLVYPGATTLRLARLPIEASWRFGPKREGHVRSSSTAVELGNLVVLDRAGLPAVKAQRSAGLFRALLPLQAGWVWGDSRTRRAIVDVTAALCDRIQGGDE